MSCSNSNILLPICLFMRRDVRLSVAFLLLYNLGCAVSPQCCLQVTEAHMTIKKKTGGGKLKKRKMSHSEDAFELMRAALLFAVHHCWQFGVSATEPTVQVVRRPGCCRAMRITASDLKTRLCCGFGYWLQYRSRKCERQLGGRQ